MTAPHEIVERALAASTTRGCVVLVRSVSVANMRWARTTLTTNGETEATSVTVIALADVEGGVAAGSVTVNAPDDVVLVDAVRRAEARAHDAGPADDAAELVSGVEASADWAELPRVATSESFAHLAPDLGEIFAAARADGIEHFGYAEQTVTTTHLGTSSGVRLRFTAPEARLELTAKSHERTRSTWIGSSGHSFDEIDLAEIDAELREALAWQARRIEVEPGRHPALLSPSSVADLMLHVFYGSTGRDAAEGGSVWSAPSGGTRVGELVADPRVSMYSDPALRGIECVPFLEVGASSGYASVFDNGIAAPHVDWIRDGILTSLITSRATAAQTGLPFRPPVENLRCEVSGGTGSVHDLVARTDDALMVTCTWYNRTVDPQTALVTGLTRDGVYVVRGGEVIGAATNFRWNDSPVSILGRVEDAGDPHRTLGREMADYFTRTDMPPMLVRDFNFSTVSAAS
ncbi:MAG TPA: metallopeptidase TldD-related protein [Candidatus Nanopelagicales bacterium]|nr:metallopeptidase TldD-related protein [Candidatus Nanopelagicales bacterium]